MVFAPLSFSAPDAKSCINVLLSTSDAVVGKVLLCLSACSLYAAEVRTGYRRGQIVIL